MYAKHIGHDEEFNGLNRMHTELNIVREFKLLNNCSLPK